MWRKAGALLAFAMFACGGAPEKGAEAPDAEVAPSAETAPEPSELDVMKVARALRGNEPLLRGCFRAGDEPVRGFMRLAFHVEASGEVSNVEIESSSFAEPEVTSCLVENIATLHFDAPGERKKSHWTFVSGLYERVDSSEGKKKRTKKQRDREREELAAQGVTIDKASRGSLEPDEVEGVVHAGFGLFAHCYREGLNRKPGLKGVVSLRMVIGRDGLVDLLKDAESDIPDPELIDCVAEGFFALRFPKPRSGTVRLVYRIAFESGV